MRSKETALAGVRVLDLTSQNGVYGTKLLADLGTEVIRIEHPQGDPLRRLGPFLDDVPHPERSLYFSYFNTSKKSITLDLDWPEGTDLFLRLVKTADVVVESFPVDYLEDLGAGYSTLADMRPGLVMTSVTPYGQTGPYRTWKGCDLTHQAMGGLLHISGWPELPPHQVACSPAYYQASVQAAAGTVMALVQRDRTGQGTHLDVSVHESVPLMLQATVHDYERTGKVRCRTGDDHSKPARGLFPCQDGYVDCRLPVQRWPQFLEWLQSEGCAHDLADEKWSDPWFRETREAMEHVDDVFRRFLATRTRDEVTAGGQGRRILIGQVQAPQEVAHDPQLNSRDYFVEVCHPQAGQTLRYPGPAYRLSATPWRVTRPAPLPGEHNDEIYGKELGLTPRQMAALKAAGVI
ncbi:MAG: CoA transferase [Chloroflexi bacterium]|nr:CoA transferase [Chloroflexota bacterium]